MIPSSAAFSGETEITLNYISHGKLPMLHGGGIAAHGEA